MKFLCICDGGNVRSYALAVILKEEKHQEAIAIGRKHSSIETIKLLCEWADIICIMQPHMIESITVEFKYKLKCFDVGPDIFGIHINPKLIPIAKQGADWLMKFVQD